MFADYGDNGNDSNSIKARSCDSGRFGPHVANNLSGAQADILLALCIPPGSEAQLSLASRHSERAAATPPSFFIRFRTALDISAFPDRSHNQDHDGRITMAGSRWQDHDGRITMGVGVDSPLT